MIPTVTRGIGEGSRNLPSIRLLWGGCVILTATRGFGEGSRNAQILQTSFKHRPLLAPRLAVAAAMPMPSIPVQAVAAAAVTLSLRDDHNRARSFTTG